MKITPIDIVHKSFSKKMFGLDPDEVSDFMTQVASTMEALIQERNSLKEHMREKDLNLLEYKERDGVLKNTIATASQMTERLRQDADREARLIIADANQKAEMIMRDSRDSLKKMYQEITELKRARMQFEANLKALVQAHLGLLEQGEKYMPQMQLPNYNMTSTPSPKSTDVSPVSAG
jgi:cell division initiation protein